MKNNILQGFGVVYRHNLRLHMKNIKYVISTIIVSLILLGGIAALIIFITKSDKDKNKKDYNVEEIYVIDETGLGAADYGMLAENMGLDYVKNTKFTVSDAKPEELIKDDKVEYLLVQTKDEETDEYVIKIITGKKIDTDDKQVKKNIDCIEEFSAAVFQNYIYMTSGLTVEQVIQVLLPVNASVEKIGAEAEEIDENKMIFSMALTFILLFVVYFVVIIYGAGICADVPMEKTSKLVEQLLMSVSPYALVSGKILAMITSCLIQFIIWLLSLVGGIFAGDLFAKAIYDVDNSFVSTALEQLKKWFEGQGFTVPAIVLAILLFMAGLVIYLLLAGLGGAMLSKPEEASNVQSVFMLPLIISYFAIFYISGIVTGGNFSIPVVACLIPYTGAMVAPGSVLIGSLSVPMAILALVIDIVLCLIELFVAAKVYEGLLFFNGNKLKFKDVVAIFKNK